MQQELKSKTRAGLAALPIGIAGSLIWCLSIGEGTQLWELLPFTIGPLLYIILGAPWRLRQQPKSIAIQVATAAGSAYVIGLTLESMLLSVVGWVLMVSCWSESFLIAEPSARRRRLLPLLLFSFPWISHDLPIIGSAFQSSGAVAGEIMGRSLHVDVIRSGNNLIVGGTNLSIGPACSGMETLQITMLCGSAIAVVVLIRSALFWLYLPILVVVAWLTNTVRIVGLVYIAGVSNSAEAVRHMHDTNGYMALLVEIPVMLLALHFVRRIGGRDKGEPLTEGARSHRQTINARVEQVPT